MRPASDNCGNGYYVNRQVASDKRLQRILCKPSSQTRQYVSFERVFARIQPVSWKRVCGAHQIGFSSRRSLFKIGLEAFQSGRFVPASLPTSLACVQRLSVLRAPLAGQGFRPIRQPTLPRICRPSGPGDQECHAVVPQDANCFGKAVESPAGQNPPRSDVGVVLPDSCRSCSSGFMSLRSQSPVSDPSIGGSRALQTGVRGARRPFRG